MDQRTAEGESASTVFARVADFVLRRSAGAFPRDVLKSAALQFLDTMGIAIAAGPMQAGQIARDAAVMLYGSGADRHAARMIFDGRRASMAGAAFAAATQTDNLDGHDGYPPTKGHIGVAVIPALLALAEEKPELTGPEALAAIVVGYEIAGRAGIALHATVSDYHTSGAWNSLGVAAVAARLLSLDDDQLRHAFGIAEYHGPRSQMMREIATPTMLHDGSGMGALVGLSAAVLAEAGFAGAPAITVEAPEVAAHWDDLGLFWQMTRQYIKPYPVCRWAHAAIDATRALCLQHGLRPEDIRKVHVNSFHYAATLFAGMPDTTSKAQYSLPFAVATMIHYGRIGVEHISGSGLRDAAVADMLKRVEVNEAAKHSDRFPAGRWADVQIETVDGRRLESGDVHARGGPEAPFSEDDIVAKYMEFASPVLGSTRAAAIRDGILGLTDADHRFSEVTALVYDPPGGQGSHAA
ncbi:MULTISPECIES: MmgE/PrpD family protein [unclassified Mesorhizobium]|uniref:MmgE/PrpD family protein n=3 Tax=Mesorhizobium TaxID=68287 RepID=UPI0024152A22|nr:MULTISPECIES: MmgE/PrpD family protein [unclassified Mesorhizobium]MDG4888046.1 MmgE/PrpD family protein [Mesorhizobium sp. WSM4887]MDG4906227.1 MmgE/PrpD family protein [Mesorhizobium sp. WSM4898]